MAMLDLRSHEPISEPTDEVRPDETPPGLEAIRAWVRKPRPWLHGVKLWIRQFAKWWRAFRKWAAENAVPAARRATELAAGGAKAARGLARGAGIAADAAKHIADMGREWRNGDGRSGRIAGAIATRAGQFRDFSIGAVRGATSAAAIGDALSRFREMLPRRKVLDVGPAPEHDDSGPARRLVPVVPRPIPKALPEPVPEALPEPVPETLPEPVPKTPPEPVPKTPPEPVPETPEAAKEPVSEPPEPQQEPLPENPGALPEPAPDPITASNPEGPASPPVEGEGTRGDSAPFGFRCSAQGGSPRRGAREIAVAVSGQDRRPEPQDAQNGPLAAHRGHPQGARFDHFVGTRAPFGNGLPQPHETPLDADGQGPGAGTPLPRTAQASGSGLPGEVRGQSVSTAARTAPTVSAERIARGIRLLRGQKVMLDGDLASLYGVETRTLVQAVKRNQDRFPSDFMFELTRTEFRNLRSQSVMPSWGGRRSLPLAFTEQGVSMLSSVLRSQRAVQVNIEIMRAFVGLRPRSSFFLPMLSWKWGTSKMRRTKFPSAAVGGGKSWGCWRFQSMRFWIELFSISRPTSRVEVTRCRVTSSSNCSQSVGNRLR